MRFAVPTDPHVKMTISVPESVMKALEQERKRISKEIGFEPPMSRLVATCLRKQLLKD